MYIYIYIYIFIVYIYIYELVAFAHVHHRALGIRFGEGNEAKHITFLLLWRAEPSCAKLSRAVPSSAELRAARENPSQAQLISVELGGPGLGIAQPS